MAFKRILCATDLSEVSGRALKIAGELAQKLHAELCVLHVVDLRGLTPGYAEVGAFVDLASIANQIEADAKKTLPEFVRKSGLPQGLGARIEVRRGVPIDAVLEVVAEVRADLVVLGTHGRSGVGRLVFGSVAEKVVRTCPVPVLTVGPERDA